MAINNNVKLNFLISINCCFCKVTDVREAKQVKNLIGRIHVDVDNQLFMNIVCTQGISIGMTAYRNTVTNAYSASDIHIM